MTLWQGKPRPVVATASGLKPGDFPIGSVESRAAMRAILDRGGDMDGSFRIVSEVIGKELDLEQSTCRRYWSGDRLIEAVCLTGSSNDLTEQQLDAFVKRFPITGTST